MLVTEYGRPEGSHRRNVDRVNAELDETRARKVRGEPKVVGGGLDPTSQVHAPGRGGALAVLPLVLPTVDRDAIGPQVHHQRQPRVVGQTGNSRRKFTRPPG